MKNKFITIDETKIGIDYKPNIIAELSANHNGDLDRAIKILEMSKRCGADALKIQTYTQDTLTIKCDKEDFLIKGGLWHGRTLYDLYSEAHMPWEWHEPLFKKARDLSLTIFSSPFDNTAVDLLEDLGAPAYKIASFEAIDLPLIEYVAKTSKPMIISTGMADQEEIGEAVEVAKRSGCRDLALLHCVSGYPAPPSDYNLATIPDIQNRYDVVTGLSDHTVDNATAISSIAMGACLIEKHVTISRSGGGPDDSFSLEEDDLRQLCLDTQTAWQALGKVNYKRKESEKGNMVFRRSLYVVEDIKSGEIITPHKIRSIRPGYGMKPKYLKKIIGLRSTKDIESGTPFTEELFSTFEKA